MNLIAIYLCITLAIVCETSYVPYNAGVIKLKKADWHTDINQNVYLKMERRYWDTYSPYQRFTIEAEGRDLASFDKEQVELVFLYDMYVQFILSYSKTVFNFELQDPNQTGAFYRAFTPVNQVPMPYADTLKYIRQVWTDETGQKMVLVGEDAVINYKKISFENSTIYIVKSRESFDGAQKPFLIFRSKKFAIVAVKYNQVVLEVMPDGKPNLLFVLAFASQSNAAFFFENVKHDSIKNQLRINVLDKFKSML